MLDELKLKQYCCKHGYNYKYFNDIAIVTTGQDTVRENYYEMLSYQKWDCT